MIGNIIGLVGKNKKFSVQGGKNKDEVFNHHNNADGFGLQLFLGG